MGTASTTVSEPLLTTAQAMLPRIQALAEEIEQHRSLPAALTQALAAAGFFMAQHEQGCHQRQSSSTSL